ncbi:MAG: glycoside hydrolase family 88 protein [Ferruginibacter sp.]
MKKSITKTATLVVACIVFCGTSIAQQTDVFKSAYIKKELLKVAYWQLTHPNGKSQNSWTNGAFYTGVVAAQQATGSKALMDSLMAMGEKKQWRPGTQYDNADDIVISQTYIDLYRLSKNQQMIQPTIDTIKKIEAIPKTYVKKRGIMWWWCDDMAPPTLAKLAATLNDPHYLVLADTLYRETYKLLFDKEEKLFARDASYLIDANGGGKREANGKKNILGQRQWLGIGWPC